MTKQQADKLCEIVNKDAEIQYDFCNSEGQTCALGGILLASGVPKEELQRLRNESLASYKCLHLDEVLLQAGLNFDQALCIQRLNDKCDNITSRRIFICEYIQSLISDPLAVSEKQKI